MKPRGWLVEKVDERPVAEVLADFFDRLERVVPSRLGAGQPIDRAFDRDRWRSELAGDLLERQALADAIVDRIAQRVAAVATIDEFREHLAALRSRSSALADLVDGAPVDDRPHVLYRLFTKDGALLYVGITDRGPRRWVEHARTKPWFGSVARFHIERFDTRAELEAREVEAIQAERPLYNVIHNPAALSR